MKYPLPALDNPELVKPTVHISVESKLEIYFLYEVRMNLVTMNLVTIIFTVVTVLVHVLVFVIESAFWLRPLVYERVLSKLNVPVDASYFEQAQILEVLFFNQGFYNLFVALGGVAGLLLYRAGKTQEGITLVCYVSLFALGASVVLASTTIAYPGAVMQGLPPLLALVGLYFSAGKNSKT